MPKYNSRDRVRSGIPLGGIGAGKIEVMPNGSLNFITFQNNWSEPLIGSKSGILGFHFGIFADCGRKKTARFLQTSRIDAFPRVEGIDYEGAFPFARLKYLDRKLPLKVEMEASSSFIPNNEKDSSLPGGVFTFRVKNPTRKKITASLLSVGRNTVGNWGVGRFNTVSSDKDQFHLTFKNGR